MSALPHPAPSVDVADVIGSDAQALDVAHRLASRFAAGAARRDRERVLPPEELAAFSASGLWGITVPREHGGAQVSNVTLAEVTAIIAAADSSLAQLPQNHFYVLELLRVGGTPAQQRQFYGLALRGARFGNALSETGRRDYQRQTRLAPLPGGGWQLDGQKFYCTGAVHAQWIPVWAAREERGRDVGVLAFVPRDQAGVTVVDDWDGFGQRITGSGSARFERVHVHDEWIIPFQASFDRPTTAGPLAQILHAAIDLGIAQGAVAAAVQQVRQHARPWIDAGVDRASDDPLTIHQFGDLAVRLRAARALVRRAGRILDEAQRAPDAASVAEASVAVAQARVLTTTVSLRAGNKLLELGGTSATPAGLGLDRYWRNARTHTLHDPVRWKYHAIGNYYLNGRLPPRHGAI
ncbi:Acyl-CoA dehydrogenase; probable dibenzothiophene desulfurization enzyme [plant metagenome]|uniref:Dibenzothiophene monooxygenase n=1 Tax=plant metagenome TaxID=1297885 RepID=A0A484V829_9ZZZZ